MDVTSNGMDLTCVALKRMVLINMALGHGLREGGSQGRGVVVGTTGH
jgi:hypothetical protein